MGKVRGRCERLYSWSTFSYSHTTEYFQTARYSVVDEPAKLRWKLQTAVGVMYNLLLVERVPGVTIVGIDAKFLLVGLRLMPGWFLDVIASAAYKIPAAMTTKL